MWYLIRTGQPEGPFAEPMILDMIRGGSLRDAQICPVGGSTWMPLAGHPPFAEALRNVQAAQSGYGPPPQQGAYGAPPAASGYGPPPQQGAYGAAPAAGGYGPPPQQGAYGAPPQSGGYGAPPQGAYGAPPGGQPPFGAPAGSQPFNAQQGAPTGQAGAQAGKAKSKLPMIIGIGAVLGVLLFGGCGYAIYSAIFKQPASALAKFFPESTNVYVECTGFKPMMLGINKVMFIDNSKLDDKKAIQESEDALAKSFGLSKDDAILIALGLRGAAVGGDVEKGSKSKQGGAIVSWDSTKAAEKLLSSKRFSTNGSLGKNGRVYELKERDSSEDTGTISPTEKALSRLHTSGNDKIVWFEKQSIMAFGTEESLKEIVDRIESGGKSLADSDEFAKAKKNFLSDAAIVGFVSRDVWDAAKSNMSSSDRQNFDKLFNDAGPVAISGAVEKAGLRIQLATDLAATNLMDGKELLKMGGKLTLYKHFPKETVAYAAYRSSLGVSGKEAKELILKELEKQKEGKDVRKNVTEAESELGIDFGDVLGAVGDEGGFGVMARAGYTPTMETITKFSWDDFGVYSVQEIKDEAIIKKTVAAFKAKAVGAPFTMTGTDDDLVLDPKDASLPRIELVTKKKRFVLAAGSKDIAARILAAADGKDTLDDDKGHLAAIDPLEAKSLLLWVDVGRIADAALKDSTVRTMASKAEFPVDAFVLTGDKRLSSSFGLDMKRDGDRYVYRLDGMNLPFIGAVGAGAFYFSMSQALGGFGKPSYDDVDTTTNSGSGVGVVCEAYLQRFERCGLPSVPAATKRQIVGQTRTLYARQSPAVRDAACRQLQSSLPANCR